MTEQTALERIKQTKISKQGPLWRGPNSEHHNGGVTQGLLGRYLLCPERARVRLIEGLRPNVGFSHRLEYGSMFHICCETYKAGKPDGRATPATLPWQEQLRKYARELCQKYPYQQDQVQHWTNVCLKQFPLYLDYWAKHPDTMASQPLLREEEFSVPYVLPSGRTVRLRGKWDGVDLITRGGVSQAGLWLVENKTKGDIDPLAIQQQLRLDNQTMLYLVALQEWEDDNARQGVWIGEACDAGFEVGKLAKIAGVKYEVIRRPLSGGKGNITRNKGTKGTKCSKCKGTGDAGPAYYSPALKRCTCPKCKGVGRLNAKPEETSEAFYERVAQYIKDDPGHYFMRWQVTVSQADLERFRRRCLDPILENLVDDWEWWEHCYKEGVSVWEHATRHLLFPHHYPRQYQLPYGISSPMLDGGAADVDAYLNDGNSAGLQRATVLFPELANP